MALNLHQQSRPPPPHHQNAHSSLETPRAANPADLLALGPQEGPVWVLTMSKVESLFWTEAIYKFHVYVFPCVPAGRLPQAWGCERLALESAAVNVSVPGPHCNCLNHH